MSERELTKTEQIESLRQEAERIRSQRTLQFGDMDRLLAIQDLIDELQE